MTSTTVTTVAPVSASLGAAPSECGGAAVFVGVCTGMRVAWAVWVGRGVDGRAVGAGGAGSAVPGPAGPGVVVPGPGAVGCDVLPGPGVVGCAVLPGPEGRAAVPGLVGVAVEVVGRGVGSSSSQLTVTTMTSGTDAPCASLPAPGEKDSSTSSWATCPSLRVKVDGDVVHVPASTRVRAPRPSPNPGASGDPNLASACADPSEHVVRTYKVAVTTSPGTHQRVANTSAARCWPQVSPSRLSSTRPGSVTTVGGPGTVSGCARSSPGFAASRGASR